MQARDPIRDTEANIIVNYLVGTEWNTYHESKVASYRMESGDFDEMEWLAYTTTVIERNIKQSLQYRQRGVFPYAPWENANVWPYFLMDLSNLRWAMVWVLIQHMRCVKSAELVRKCDKEYENAQHMKQQQSIKGGKKRKRREHSDGEQTALLSASKKQKFSPCQFESTAYGS